MITLDNLTYIYRGSVPALNGITAQIGPGIHLLLGENGAGKTTLLHVIAGMRIPLMPSMCLIDGEPVGKRLPSVMRKVFLVSDNMDIPFATIEEMTVRHAVFYPTFNPEMLRRNLEKLGMTGREHIDEFSLGNRKKAILAYALALGVEILLLDEPANGLDISAKQKVLSMMAECVGEDQTVILSTHTVSDFRQLFDSVMVLSVGQLMVNRPVWEITEIVDFVTSDTPLPEAIYVEQTLGRFSSIVPHVAGSLVTDIDYVMLYNAIHSPSSGPALMKLLNTPES